MIDNFLSDLVNHYRSTKDKQLLETQIDEFNKTNETKIIVLVLSVVNYDFIEFIIYENSIERKIQYEIKY